MTRVSPHGVLPLAGCLLAASLVCGGPAVARALAPPGADGHSLALAGTPPRPAARVHTGLASWYGPRWQGRRTASGARYEPHHLTAAHRTAPFGTEAVVTNLANGRVVRVRITDRGPHTRQRILDLSYAAARQLDMLQTGTTRVQVEWLAAAAPRA
jgi:rare lipoprotein A